MLKHLEGPMDQPARRRRRRWIVRAVLLALVGVLAIKAGCATTVVPPAAVDDPLRVYLVDQGRHASVVLPRAEGTLVEYTYGDWEWYAENKTGFFNALNALFIPSRGALGRREIERIPDDPADLRRTLFAEEVFPLTVERGRAGRLLERLDRQYEANLGTRLYNPEYQLDFVHHPTRYHVLRNSNHMVAAWLEDLECETRGWTVLSRWKVVEPE
jgi:hypothetical protein